MKRKALIIAIILTSIVIVALSLIIIVAPIGVQGRRLEVNAVVSYEVWIDNGDLSVYSFQDTETGIWYISTDKGISPRLNRDGTLYRTAPNKQAKPLFLVAE